MRISDWSSDVCSSDLPRLSPNVAGVRGRMGLCRTAGEPTPAAAAPPYADVTYADVTYAGVTGDPSSRIPFMPLRALREIGRAACRERVGQYVSISVVAVSLQKKKKHIYSQWYI